MASLSRVVHCLEEYEIDYDVMINEQRPVPGFVLGLTLAMLAAIYLRETGSHSLIAFGLVPGICAGLGLKFLSKLIDLGQRLVPSLMIGMLVYLYIMPLNLHQDYAVPVAVTLISLILSRRPLSLAQERVLAHERLARKRRRKSA